MTLRLRLLAFAVVAILAADTAAAVSPRDVIGRVARAGTQWVISDGRGRRSGSVAAAGTRLVGHNRRVCVLTKGGEYLFYDKRGRLLHRADTLEFGHIASVTADVVTVDLDSVRITYGPDLRESSRRLMRPVAEADSSASVAEKDEEVE